jgi:diguanylate cyclase (GGDEF)-like protein
MSRPSNEPDKRILVSVARGERLALWLSNEPDERILASFAHGERLALWLSVFVAAVTLLLWFFPSMAAFAPRGWSRMDANTAAALLLAAASLALSAPQRSASQVRTSQIMALVLLIFSFLTLIEYVPGPLFGIDTWLPNDPKVPLPGRPSLQTTAAFFLLGTNLLLIRQYKNGKSIFSDICALTLLASVLVLAGSYVYGAIDVVGIDATTLTSPQTLLCLFALAFVVASRRAQQGGLLSVIVGVGIGSQIVRRVFPIGIALPFLRSAVDGYLINLNTLEAQQARSFASAAVSLLVLGLVVWMAWRINALERELRELSLTDELTGTHNRRGFYVLAEQAVRAAIRAGSGLTVLFFDLDGLKQANDTAGHEAGSMLLQKLASILLDTFRESDIVGRVGGDEFAVVMNRQYGSIANLVKQVERKVSDFNKSPTVRCKLSFSVGHAKLEPGNTATFDELMVQADTLMYAQKIAKRKVRPPSTPSAAVLDAP